MKYSENIIFENTESSLSWVRLDEQSHHSVPKEWQFVFKFLLKTAIHMEY